MSVRITTTTMGFNIAVTRRGEILGSSVLIQNYTRKLENWKWDKVEERKVLMGEYYYFDQDQQTCYFPLFELDDFKTYLTENGAAYTIVHKPPTEGVGAYFHMMSWVSYKNDKQKGCVEFLTNKNSGPLRGVALQTGSGKLQDLDSAIRTPYGWEKMRDMYVGKDIIAPDGTVTKVSGVYPQGVVPMYRISFEDGRFTECGADHLWKVNYVQWKDKWRVITTEQIAQYLTQPTYAIRMGVPLIKSEIKDDVDLPIDPYVLGVILGDGAVSVGTSVNICKPDQFIKDELDRVLDPNYVTTTWHADSKSYIITRKDTNRSMMRDIEDLGLSGKRSWEKFIPEVYMNGSTQQRLSLVQGLMDTDGTVGANPVRGTTEKVIGKGSTIQYCTTSLKLATQFQELIRSLGGLCRLSTKLPFYTYKNERHEGRVAYILHVRYQNPKDLFRLPRKKERVSDEYQYKDRLKLRIKSVEYVGDKEAQCIAVDHPDHLYITDDYIVTHNTVSFIWALEKLAVRSMITMTSRLDQWVDELQKYTTLDEDDIYVVKGNAALTKLFTLIDDKLKPKIILMSTKTMRMYMDYGPAYQHLPHPTEMCDKLGIGIVGTDEYHEHFYTNFLIGLMLNPAVFIPITATFIANDPFVKNIFDKFIPKEVQFVGGEYEKFVNVTSYTYNSGGYYLQPFHYQTGKGYSQVLFEKYLLGRGKKLFDNVLQSAILPIIKMHYTDMAEPGERFLFLCSKTEMCDYLVTVFKQRFPNKTVTAFHSGMSSLLLEKFDMIISTPGSAGTGRDVKNLRTCFVFVNCDSEIQNTQFLGRLRGPPQMMNTPEFVTLAFKAIPQHMRYLTSRSILYGPKAKSYHHRSLP